MLPSHWANCSVSFLEDFVFFMSFLFFNQICTGNGEVLSWQLWDCSYLCGISLVGWPEMSYYRLWITDGVTVIRKAAECICLNFYKLSNTFSSWKQCTDSGFPVQLIGTSGRRLDGPCLETSQLPKWAEGSFHSLKKLAILDFLGSSVFVIFYCFFLM